MKEKFTSVSSALLAVAGAAPTWTTAGILSLLGLAGSAAVVVARWLTPVLVGLAVVLLARAFYVLYVQKQGNFASKLLTWFSALFIIGFWTWRLW